MRILRDDCRLIMRLLGDRSFDHVLTDPPYLPHVHTNSRRSVPLPGVRSVDGAARSLDSDYSQHRELGFEPLAADLRKECAQHFARLARRWIIVFTDHEGGEAWKQDLIAAGAEFVRFGVWVKSACTPQFSGDRPAVGHEVIVLCHAQRSAGERLRWNGHGRPAVWEYAPPHYGGEDVIHTTQKPLPLTCTLLRDFTDPDELILDPFAGAGTTLVACRRLGRRALGVEIDPKWAAAADRRVAATREQIQLFEQAPRHNGIQLTLGLDGGAAAAVQGVQR